LQNQYFIVAYVINTNKNNFNFIKNSFADYQSHIDE